MGRMLSHTRCEIQRTVRTLNAVMRKGGVVNSKPWSTQHYVVFWGGRWMLPNNLDWPLQGLALKGKGRRLPCHCLSCVLFVAFGRFPALRSQMQCRHGSRCIPPTGIIFFSLANPFDNPPLSPPSSNAYHMCSSLVDTMPGSQAALALPLPSAIVSRLSHLEVSISRHPCCFVP